jgi:hypothetical protein
MSIFYDDLLQKTLMLDLVSLTFFLLFYFSHIFEHKINGPQVAQPPYEDIYNLSYNLHFCMLWNYE